MVLALVVALVLVWHRYDAHKYIRGRPWILRATWNFEFAIAVWAYDWRICNDGNDRREARR